MHLHCDLAVCECICYSTDDCNEQEGTKKLAGVSRAVILHVCAQQAQQVQAFKLARWAHTQLQSLRLPSSWQVSDLHCRCHHAYDISLVEPPPLTVVCTLLCELLFCTYPNFCCCWLVLCY